MWLVVGFTVQQSIAMFMLCFIVFYLALLFIAMLVITINHGVRNVPMQYL
jgi:hypothetical protein